MILRKLLTIVSVAILFIACREASSPPHFIGSWLNGDVHTHTVHSDGSGTMAENFDAGKKVGIHFIAITDHNTASGWEDALEAAENTGIIPIWGIENCDTNNPSLHTLLLACRPLPFSRMNTETLTIFKNDAKNAGAIGLVYVAHPFEWGNHWGSVADINDDEAWETTWRYFWANVHGIEVWNAWYGANHRTNWGGNEEARKLWDALNRRGLRLMGIATTDTHSPCGIGQAWTSVLAEEHNARGILAGMKRGRMYGSNGPTISFTTENVMMGDTFVVPEAGQTITINLSGQYKEPLYKVVLLKNGTIINKWQINAKDFNIDANVVVQPGDFVRMEVVGKENDGRTHTGSTEGRNWHTTAAFAFSNPIFFI